MVATIINKRRDGGMMATIINKGTDGDMMAKIINEGRDSGMMATTINNCRYDSIGWVYAMQRVCKTFPPKHYFLYNRNQFRFIRVCTPHLLARLNNKT